MHRLYRQKCLAVPRNHFLSGLWPGPCSCSEQKSLCLPRHFWMISASNVVGTVLSQHDFAPVHKTWSMKAWLDEFGVEELN